MVNSSGIIKLNNTINDPIPRFDWNYDYHKTIIDNLGNLYITGLFSGSNSLGHNNYLYKFNSTLGLEWEKTWVGGYDQEENKVFLDYLGNIYHLGPIRIDRGEFPSNKGIKLMIYNQEGLFLSESFIISNKYDVWIFDICLDNSGNIFTCGEYGYEVGRESYYSEFLILRFGIDTDGDGFSDNTEELRGTDPYDPNDYPRENIPGYDLLFIISIIGISILLIILRRKKFLKIKSKKS